MHEARCHLQNCMITLTYAPKYLPYGGSLRAAHLRDFWKRLRKRFSHVDEFGNHWFLPIRYFGCGEYGAAFSRPHYHALLFGLDFPDKVLCADRKGVRSYTSSILDELWGMGRCEVGTVTFASASYVAGYVTKKVTGPASDRHYRRLDVDTGDLLPVAPEFCVMSRRPGIGANWFKRFGNEVFPSDKVILRREGFKPPRYYEKLAGPEIVEPVKQARMRAQRKRHADCTPERLEAREVCARARAELSHRALEDL